MVSSYKEHLRQLSIWGIVILIIVSVINILTIPLTISRPFMSNEIKISTDVVRYTYAVSMVCIVFITVRAFSFVNKRTSCDIYHSLPVKRTTLYKSVLVAVITWVTISIILPQCVFFIYLVCRGMNVKEALGIMLLWIFASLYICSVTVIGMTGSGNTGRGLVTSFVLIFAPRITLIIAKLVFIEAMSLDSYGGKYNLLSPLYCVGTNIFENLECGYEHFRDVLMGLVFTVPFTIAFFFAGAELFKYRKSEMCGTYKMNKVVQRVFQVAILSVPCICLAGLPLLEDDMTLFKIGASILMVTVAVFIFFVIETERKYNKVNMVKALKRLPILIVAMVMLLIATFVEKGISKKQIVTPGKTDYVTFYFSDAVNLTSFDRIISEIEFQKKITDEQIIELLYEENQKNIDDRTLVINTYFDNGGFVYTKDINIGVDCAEKLAKILVDEGYVNFQNIITSYSINNYKNRILSDDVIITFADEIQDRIMSDYLIFETGNEDYLYSEGVREDGNGGYYLDLSHSYESYNYKNDGIIRIHVDDTLPDTLAAIERYMEGEND